MRAIKSKIIVIKDKYPEKIGNIYVPIKKGSHAPPYSGIIRSVGETVKDTDLKEGVRILFHDLAGIEIEYNNEMLIILDESSVVAVVENNMKII